MKRNSIITSLSVLVIVASLIATLWLDSSIGARVAEIVSIITAIIGAIALFIQFKKDKEINTASFLMDYSKSFYNDYDLLDIYSELDKANADESYTFDYEKYRAKIVVYLEWIESIASLIERKVIDFYTIDNILSYRFFVIVNNKQVQDNELLPFAEYYRGTFYLYDKWYKYENKRGLSMSRETTALHLVKDYDKIIEMITEKINTK